MMSSPPAEPAPRQDTSGLGYVAYLLIPLLILLGIVTAIWLYSAHAPALGIDGTTWLTEDMRSMALQPLASRAPCDPDHAPVPAAEGGRRPLPATGLLRDAPFTGYEFRLSTLLKHEGVLLIDGGDLADAEVFIRPGSGPWQRARPWPAPAGGRAFGLTLPAAQETLLRACVQSLSGAVPGFSLQAPADMPRHGRAALFAWGACAACALLILLSVSSERSFVGSRSQLLAMLAFAACMVMPPWMLSIWRPAALHAGFTQWAMHALALAMLLAYVRYLVPALRLQLDGPVLARGLSLMGSSCTLAVAAAALDPRWGYMLHALIGIACSLGILAACIFARNYSRHATLHGLAALCLCASFSGMLCAAAGALSSGAAAWLLVLQAPLFALALRLDIVLRYLDRYALLLARLEQQAQLRHAELDRHAAERLKEFASVNHDLRQPVQSLGILLSLLHGRTADAHTARVVQQLLEVHDSMAIMVDALLDVARVEAGALAPHWQAVPLAPLLKRLCDEYRELAAARRTELRHVPTRATVRSDPKLLERVLRNLLSNAVQGTQNGRIVVGCRRRAGQAVEVQIHDTGSGLDEAMLQALRQAHYQPVRRQGRAGLGLFVVTELCRSLDHGLAVHSVPGRGTSFGVRLACCAPSAHPADVPVLPQPQARLRVLCIEDDPQLRDALRLLMESQGHQVWTARNRRQALDMLVAGFVPTAVIADYALSEDDGVAVLTSLERLLKRRLPAVILSAAFGPGALAQADRGDRILLRKPVETGALLQALARLSAPPGAEGDATAQDAMAISGGSIRSR